MKEPRWIDSAVIRAVHEELIAEHGGSSGIRDEGLLESALGRPRNRFAHGTPTPFERAAAYAFGIARNHPFVDGNKRTALMAAYVFLGLNGIELDAPEAEAVITFLALAAGEIDEDALARWFERHSQKK